MKPPRLADWVLDRVCKDALREEIKGDLYEYYVWLDRTNARFRSLKYWYHALQFLRPFALKPFTTTRLLLRTMFKMNLLVAYRNLLRNKLYAFINVLGLGLGLAICLLIGIFVREETSYDKHWPNAERIFRVGADLKFEDNEFLMATAPAPMAEAFKKDFPEIRVSGRFRPVGQQVLKVGERYFNQDRTVFADQSMLEIFQLNVIDGSLASALSQPNQCIISQQSALKLFGSSDAVGSTIEMQGTPLQVMAVYQDIPDNSHFHFELMVSMENRQEANNNVWLSNNFKTYFLLQEGADYKVLESKFSTVYEKYFGPQLEQMAGVTWGQMINSGSRVHYFLQPVTDIHLRSNLQYEIEAGGNIQYVYILGAAAIFVLIIASINFMNISTARSSLRAREVGMRKVLGGIRPQLIVQFIIESVLNATLALAIAVGLVYLLLPVFNNLTDKTITNPFFGVHDLWIDTLVLTVSVGVMAGFYPALYLSRFSPVRVLKGDLSLGSGSAILRNTLVIIQFVASILLIFGSIVIYQQLQYTQTKSLGFNKDQVIVLNETHTLNQGISAFRDELLSSPNIHSASVSGYLPTNSNRSDSPLQPKGSSGTESAVGMQLWSVDEHYIETLQLKLVEGRNFLPERASDSAAIILNRTALSRLGLEDPIGRRLQSLGDFTINGKAEFEIIGIIEDFHFDHFKNKIAPLGLLFGPSTGRLSLRYSAENTEQVLAFLESKWREFNPGRPLDYGFMDQQFASSYRSEQKLGTLFGAFAVLSIIIACLGLFGLAAYTSDQKKKEIGVRKVLGASTVHLVIRQLRGYTTLLGVALVLGLPLGHFLMQQWLSDFAYRTRIDWLVYSLPALLVLALAWSTVSLISYKAANQNPVENLRDE